MTKSELQGILNRINSLTPDDITEYCLILKLCVEKLQTLQQEDKNPLLDTWLDMGLKEIKRELNDRFTSAFNSLSTDRQRKEVLYSRSIVSMTLTNILMHL